MGKYFYLYKNHLATLFEYRSDLYFSLLTEAVALVGIVIYWNAVYASNSSVGNLGLGEMLAYYLLLPFIFYITQVNISDFIGKDIKDGVLSNYLIKPMLSQLYYITKLLARKSVNLILLMPFYVLPFFFLAYFNLYTPQLIDLVLCLIMIISVLPLYIALDFFIGYSAFWVDDVWAFRHIKDIVIGSLGGLYFPLSLVKGSGLVALVNLLPFKFMYYVPMNYLLGKYTVSDLAGHLLEILIWFLIFTLLALLMWKKGLQKYEAFGK